MMAKQQQTKDKQTTAVQPAQSADNALVMVQDQVPDYIKQNGPARGNEHVTTDDIVIPRLEIVQAMSPQVKDGDPKFDDAARPGMLVNSVTGQLYGKEVMVIPVYYTKQWLVWKARKDKEGKPLEGGFFGAYPSPEEAKDRQEQEGGEAGNIEVIDTPQHLCLLVDVRSGVVEEVMISMPRTKAKVSRNWNSMVKLAGGDRFSRVYRVTTQLEKKPKGDFYNFAVAQSGFPAQPLYKRAETLYEAVAAGDRRVVMDTSDFGEDDAAVETGDRDF
jgi:hypothetical protein